MACGQMVLGQAVPHAGRPLTAQPGLLGGVGGKDDRARSSAAGSWRFSLLGGWRPRVRRPQPNHCADNVGMAAPPVRLQSLGSLPIHASATLKAMFAALGPKHLHWVEE